MVISSDGRYVSIFSTFKQPDGCSEPKTQQLIVEPLETFNRGSTVCKLCMPSLIISTRHKPSSKVNTEGHDPNLHLGILCSSNGTLHVFLLMSDTKLRETMIERSKKPLPNRWNNLRSMLLPKPVARGSAVRIHLRDVPADPSSREVQHSLQQSRSVFSSEPSSAPRECILQGLRFFVFMRNGDSDTLSILCESGCCLKFSL